MTESAPTDCETYENVVQHVLDRELPLTALESPHVATCVNCRGLASAARALAAFPTTSFAAPVVPSDRIVSVVANDYRTRRRLRIAGRSAVTALAASLVVGAFLYLQPVERLEVSEAPPRQLPQPAPAPRVSDRFADAGSAIASITRKATDQTVAPTRQFLPPSTTFTPIGGGPGVEPVSESLASVPSAAKAGFEPLASTTRRAVNLFMRDTGLGATQKPKS